MAKKGNGGDLVPVLAIGLAIAGLVWLSKRNPAAGAVPVGVATTGGALPPGATNAAGSTFGATSDELNPALAPIGATALDQIPTGTTNPISEGSTNPFSVTGMTY